MASRQISSLKSQTPPLSFTEALASALYEWTLIFMLFINAMFAYLITRFAHYSGLQTPCLLCSRLDHILGKKQLRHYWDLVCTQHKSEISSLVYCRAHGKLVDVHGMCETCLFSFATINKSNAETYRLLVGKLGEDSCFGLDNDFPNGSVSTSTRYCTCCNQQRVPRGYPQMAEPKVTFKIPSFGHLKTNKQAVEARDFRKKKVGFYHSPHVEYTQLKIHSDTESEVAFSDDDCGVGMDHSFQTVELEPLVITLPYDLVTEKLIDPVSASEPLNSMKLQEIDFEKRPILIPEIDSFDYALETSKRVELSTNAANERELISFDDVPLTSDTREHTADDTKESKLISFEAFPSSEARECSADVTEERELLSLHDFGLPSDVREHPGDISSRSNAHEAPTKVLIETELTAINDVPTVQVSRESPVYVLKERELVSLHEITSTSEAREENNVITSFNEVPQSLATDGIPLEVSKESGPTPVDDILPVSESSFPSSEPVEPLAEVSTEKCETKLIETEESYFTEDDELRVVRDESSTTKIALETNSLSSVPFVAVTTPEAISINSTLNIRETASETTSSLMQGGDALDITDDAYTITVGDSGKHQSSGAQTQQWMGKDSSKASEDLKALLMQISASRGIELLSPRDLSPKISVNSDDGKNNLDDMHLVLHKRMLERNESNLSLEGVAVCEIEGESETDRLKRQVDHDWRLLASSYKELEEERSASAVAANQAMAMITRLQEEKALFQMEALQNLRMMEEQAEYDMEAIQKLNDLLAEREKEIQDLEAELEFYQNQSLSSLAGTNTVANRETSKISENPGDMETIQKLKELLVEREKEIQELEIELEFYQNQSAVLKAAARPERTETSENPSESKKEDVAEMVLEADMPHNKVSNLIKNSLLGFEDERLYINDCLEKIEKKLHHFSNNGIHTDLSSVGCSAEEGEEAYSLKDVNIDETRKNHSPLQEHVSSYEKTRNMVSVEDEVSELHERLEMLKGDLYFLEHVINSLGHGNEGMQFIKEIASHLQTLRSFNVQRSDQLKPH